MKPPSIHAIMLTLLLISYSAHRVAFGEEVDGDKTSSTNVFKSKARTPWWKIARQKHKEAKAKLAEVVGAPSKKKKGVSDLSSSETKVKSKAGNKTSKKERRAAALPKSHRITLQIIMLHQQERRRHLLRTNFLLGLARPSA